MKYLKYSFLLLLIALSITGCKLKGESNYTPSISLLNPAHLNTDSTLSIKINNNGNLAFDSLHVNDTVLVRVFAQSYANSLETFEFSADKDSEIKFLVNDTIKKYFDASSDFDKGKIKCLDNTVYINFPLHFVVKKKVKLAKIGLTVESDAKSVENRRLLILEFPVK